MNLVVVGFALAGLPLFIVIALLNMLSFSEMGWEFKDFFNDIDELADKAHLLPIPLFVFAGFILARSKAPDRLVRLADAALGALPGGLAIVSIVACTFFTTFTGASGVTIIALGGLLYPVLIQRRYPEQFSLGLLTSSGSLGLLFFPALPVFIFAVVYGITTETSDVTPEGLFLAGFLPGVLLTLVMCVYAWIRGTQLGIERRPFSMSELVAAFKDAIFEALLPVFLVGMVVGGYASLNEVATLTCVYLMIVEMVIHRDIHPIRDLPKLVAESMVLVGAIVLIMSMVMPGNDVLKDQRVPEQILAWFEQFIDSKIGFLMVLNLFLLVVGCLMDIFSAIVAVLPLLIPLAQRYGVEPLHLGVVFLANLEIGYLTPPVGMNLFISSFQFKKPVLSVYKSVIPFIGLLFAALLIITYVPWLSSALPDRFLMVPIPESTAAIYSQMEEEEECICPEDDPLCRKCNADLYEDDASDEGDTNASDEGDLGGSDDGDLGSNDDGDLTGNDDDGDLTGNDDGDLTGNDDGDLTGNDDGDLTGNDNEAKAKPKKPPASDDEWDGDLDNL
jgi:tripartite ATP-independent transporter DctM subunit